jgi:RHS repeat-associated protein
MARSVGSASLVLLPLLLLSVRARAQNAFVTNSTNNGMVTVIDTASNLVTATISVGAPGQATYGVAVTRDGTQVFVTNQDTSSSLPGTVSVIGTGADASCMMVGAAPPCVTSVIPVGVSPMGVAVTPDGSHVFVANEGTSGSQGTVSVIGLTPGATCATAGSTPPCVTATINVAQYPYWVAVTPDGSRAFVACVNGGPDTVTVIDTATDAVTGYVQAGAGSVSVAITPDGSRALVANEFDNTVSVIAATTNPPSLIGTIPLSGTPFAMAITPDGTEAYVTTSIGSLNVVSVIDIAGGKVVATISIPSRSWGIAFTPLGAAAYVPNDNNPGTVSVIGTGPGATCGIAGATPPCLTGTISVGGFPTTIAIEGAAPVLFRQLAKLLGGPDCPGQCQVAQPIDVASGNMFEQATDYVTAGRNKLAFTRYYNTRSAPTFAATLGVNWRSNYDRYIRIASPSAVTIERADGQQLNFTLNGSSWTPDSDVDIRLTQTGSGVGSTWTLTDHDDTVETYSTTSAAQAVLTSIRARNGYTQSLAYNAANQLISVTDSYNRRLSFTFSGGLLATVTTPDATTLTYGYNALSGGNQLTSIAYSTSPVTRRVYLYENASLPFALTGIIDEDGNRYATWTYDSQGRALTSQLGAGADLTTIAYDDSTGNRTITNALGDQEVYKFTTLQGVPKVTEIDRLATSTTMAAPRTFSYDGNGYAASQTDWNGNLTTYVNDIHGQPTTINEAVGTPQARTTAITYLPNFHLPASIITPGLTTAFTYDSAGELLTKTLADTTTTTVPYSSNGQTRTWTNTWSNFLLASTKGSRTDISELTSFTYDGSGALTKITNALGQATNITAHTGGGLPLTIVDPNKVATTLTYDARQRLLTSTLSTAAGALTTTYTYDAAGNLLSTRLPDGSALTNVYDTAHRLTNITDLFNQSITYTLDALGDKAQINTANASGAVTRRHSGNFDALGRTLQDIGGVGQTTSYAYDPNGNALSITDPLARVTGQSFDALNRLVSATDPNSGVTATAYDAHDRITTVTDPNGNTTTYIYDGFGNLIEKNSPDAGSTVYLYDPASNLIQSVDAAGIVTNRTYDALDRISTTTYPADAAKNVSYTYDQSGHGFGVGRLTTLHDAVGTLSRSYDERGNLLSERRVATGTTLLTAFVYDAASRISSITYPSGSTVTYSRDIMGRVTELATNLSGAKKAVTVLSAIAYQPFGPVAGLTFGNSVAEMRSFDLDYRLNTLTDAGKSAVQKLAYDYDAADNVLSIADGVTAGNSQSFGYDVLNRLTGATGAYGTFGYSYDKVGNQLTQTLGPNSETFSYAPQSNRLSSVTGTALTGSVGYAPAGNINSFTPGLTLVYNKANRLASVRTPAQAASYTYDAFGQRLVKALPGTPASLYQYDAAGDLLEENNNGAKTDYIYLDGTPVAIVAASSGKLYFIHDDRLGTPERVTDSGQKIVWNATYQPFGESSVSGSITQNLRLPGRYFDPETGFNHNGFRDYVPLLGRYVESDPIGLASGLNTYQYANDNPTKNFDFSGLIGESVWGQFKENYERAETIATAAGALHDVSQYPELAEKLGQVDELLAAGGSELPLLAAGGNIFFREVLVEATILDRGASVVGATAYTFLGNHSDAATDAALDSWFNRELFSSIGLDYGPVRETVAPPTTYEEFLRLYSPKGASGCQGK